VRPGCVLAPALFSITIDLDPKSHSVVWLTLSTRHKMACWPCIFNVLLSKDEPINSYKLIIIIDRVMYTVSQKSIPPNYQ